jgi:hypothetical protein
MSLNGSADTSMEGQQPPTRPVDVDTGFWLWMTALPVLVIGQAADTVLARDVPSRLVVYGLTGLFLVLVCAVVVTFLMLVRQGYRWARTLLTGGGIASVVYVVTNLFTVERTAPAAVTYAVTGIIGSVLVGGGVYLLHRKDAHAYFTR